jgi:hypothetical protein
MLAPDESGKPVRSSRGRKAIMFRTMVPAATCLFAVAASTAQAQSTDELARQLSNPVASLISVPLQFNTNSGFVWNA